MLIGAVLCLCAAVGSAAMGVRALARPLLENPAQRVLRAVAPTQLAAAVMFAAGGVVALSERPSVGLLVLCVAVALATVAAGVWQGARYAQVAPAVTSAACRRSGKECAGCTLSCH